VHRSGRDSRPQFYDLLRHTRAPTYVAFDLIWLNGDDLRPLSLSERRPTHRWNAID
jgi:ATP-dependent DNA ligase